MPDSGAIEPICKKL